MVSSKLLNVEIPVVGIPIVPPIATVNVSPAP
jgi:hypothetical protein